jgi:hypothetical protein
MTAAFELDINGHTTPKQDWADAMELRLAPEVDRWVRHYGGRPISPEVEVPDSPSTSFHKWTVTALMEIAGQSTGAKEYGLRSVGQWRFKGDLDWLREAVQTDFVLLSLFRDIRQTTGRVIGGLIGGVHTYFTQVGVACVIDLRDGRMVWCNARRDKWGDLAERHWTERAVADLLMDLYHPKPK